MAKYKFHIFICQNSREEGHPRGSCNPGGQNKLAAAFRSSLKNYPVSADVRVNPCGCLDHCEHGPMVVIYPQAWWYGKVNPEDADEIVKALAEDKTVDRLLLSDDCIHTPVCAHKKTQ